MRLSRRAFHELFAFPAAAAAAGGFPSALRRVDPMQRLQKHASADTSGQPSSSNSTQEQQLKRWHWQSLGPRHWLTCHASCAGTAAACPNQLLRSNWGPSVGWSLPRHATLTTGTAAALGSGPPGEAQAAEAHGVLVVPLPKLSHQMTRGRLVKWHKRPGDAVERYDVLMEVEADDLVEEVFKVGDFAGTVTLLVESQEEGFIADILVGEGQDLLPAGTPVALFVETEDDLARHRAAAGRGEGYVCPTSDVYDESKAKVDVLPWQSFLKEGSRSVKCMG